MNLLFSQANFPFEFMPLELGKGRAFWLVTGSRAPTNLCSLVLGHQVQHGSTVTSTHHSK